MTIEYCRPDADIVTKQKDKVIKRQTKRRGGLGWPMYEKKVRNRALSAMAGWKAHVGRRW